MKKIVLLFLACLPLLCLQVAFGQTNCTSTILTTPVTCSGGTDGTAKVVLSGSGTASSACQAPVPSNVTCTSGCTQTVSANSGDINVAAGQKVCITASNFTGGITVSGGTLVICGNATPSYFNLNNNGAAFTLVINGAMKLGWLNGNAAVTVRNFGTLTVDGAGLNGPMENNGTFVVNGTFNQNTANGSLVNRGTINVTNGDFNNNTTFSNGGTIRVSGNFTNNSNSTFTNLCAVTVGNNFFVNGGTTAVNRGTIKLENTNAGATNELTVNGSGTLKVDAGSVFQAKRLTNNARIEGIGATCGSIKISGNTLINSGAVFTGRVDLCDANGIETNNGMFQSLATSDCSCSQLSATYAWSAPLTGVTGNLATNLAAGNYSVNVQPTGCPVQQLNFTIGSPSALALNLTTSGLMASTAVTGGTGGYAYAWQGATGTASSQTYTQAGTYSVTVTDSKFCSKTEPFTLSATPPPSCNFTIQKTDPLCADGKGSATILKGGSAYVPSSGTGSVTTSCLSPLPSTVNCTSGCTQTVSGNTGDIKVMPGQKVCVTSTDFRGGFDITGGTLVVCGNATPSYLNLNNNGAAFNLVINGKLKLGWLNGNAAVTVTNYGQLVVDGAGLNGPFENNGSFVVNGTFNQNTPSGSLVNRGIINVANGDFNNNTSFLNGGTIAVSGTFHNNSNSTFTNLCTVTVGNNFFVNSGTVAINKGSIKLGNVTTTGELTVNGNGLLQVGAGSLFEAKRLMNNAKIEGIGASCGLIKVSGNTVINSTGVFTGNVDLCDANGIETNNGTFQSPASFSCRCLSPIVWSAPLTGTSPTQSNLSPGTYTVIINEPGCAPETLTFTIVAPPAIVATATVQGLKATVTASGGTGALTYTWPGEEPSTSAMHTFVNYGKYKVTVKDANGCIFELPITLIDPSIKDVCKTVNIEYTADGKIKITCVCPDPCNVLDPGGNPLDPGTLIKVPKNDSTVNVLLGDGSVIQVLVKGNNTDEGGNNNPNNTLTVSYTTTPTSGVGSNNGTIKLTITNGSGDYTIINNTNGQTNSTTINGLPTGVTTITVIDNKTGHQVTIDVPITTIPPSVVTIQVVSTNPDGTAKEVKADITPPGGFNTGPYNVVWSTGVTTTMTGNNTGTTVSTPTIPVSTTAVQTGFVSATVTDVFGNTFTTIISVVPSCPVEAFVPMYSYVLPLCNGLNNGQIALTNLPANTTAQWSGGATVQSGTTASGLYAGEYRLYLFKNLTNTTKCAYYDGPVSLVEPAKLTVAINDRDGGNPYTALATGGTPVVSYSWTGGTQGAVASFTNPGTYYVTATDSKNCTAKDYVIVPPVICVGTISVSFTSPTCVGGNSGKLIASYSVPNASFFWSGTGSGIATASNPSQTTLTRGDYNITVRQANSSCIAYAGVTLTDPAPLLVTHQLVGNKVNIVVKGGKPNYEVKWKHDNLINDSRSDLESGKVYTVDIKDANNCPASYTFTLPACAENPIKVEVLVSGTNATPLVTGGVGAYTYLWSAITPGLTVANPNVANRTGLANGEYKLVVTDNTNICKGQAKIVVPNCDLSVVPTQVTAPPCPSNCVGGVAKVTVSPMAIGTVIVWDNKAIGPDLLNACAGTHSIKVTTANGCSVETTLVVTPATPICPDVDPSTKCQNNNLAVTLVQKLEKKCFSDFSEVDIKITGGVAPLTLLWTATLPGRTEVFKSDKEDLQNPEPGTYSLVVRDVNTCSTTYSVNVAGPVSELKVDNKVTPAVCEGGFASAQILPSGGKSPYRYLWPDASTVSSKTDLTAKGTGKNTISYVVKVKDAAECEVQTVVQVIDPIFQGEIFSSNTKLCVEKEEEATLTAALVTGYSYTWTGPGITGSYVLRSLKTKLPGTYSLKYTQAGCDEKTSTVVIGTDTDCNKVSVLCAPIELEDLPTDEIGDCINQQVVAAKAQGNYQYGVYLEEEKRNFKANFINTIMNEVQESLTMKYSDQEHHYTLYYYDQAGNLVRTVPPAGINSLDATKTAQATTDLQNGTNTVFTEHTLATTYRYNSLNQLIAQDMPDHRKQNVWETGASAITLDANQKVAAIGYASSTTGLLLANTSQYAEVFTTIDQGATWTKQVNLGIGDILDVQKLDASVAYASGKGGTFLKSTDGGQNWLLKSAPTTVDLGRVYFRSATTGIILGANRSIWTTLDGGETWGNENPALQAHVDVVYASWFEGLNLWVVGAKAGKTALVTSTDNGANWTLQSTYSVGNYSSIAANGTTYLLGTSHMGTLLELDGGQVKIKRTNLPVGIRQLNKTGTGFVAIGSDNVLYTGNATGTQWTVANASQMNVDKVVALPTKQMAITADNKLGENGNWGSFASVPNFATLKNVRFTGLTSPILNQSNAGGYELLSGDKLAYRGLGQSAWTLVSTSNLPSSEVLKDAVAMAQDEWLLLGNTGILYATVRPAAVGVPPVVPANTLNVSTTGITGVDRLYTVGTDLYALMANGQLQKISKLGSTWVGTLVTTLPLSNLLDLQLEANGVGIKATASFAGNGLRQYNGSTWTNTDAALVPAQLRAVQVRTAGTGFVAGDNGEIYQRNGSTWEYRPHVTDGLSFTDISNDDKLRLANGQDVYVYAANALTKENATTFGSNISELDVEGTRAVATTTAGLVQENSGTGWATAYNGTQRLNAIDAISSGADIAGGKDGLLYLRNAGTGVWSVATMPRIQPLSALATGDNGLVLAVGKQGTIVTSGNNGQSWLPRYANTTQDLLAVTVKETKAVVAGNGGTVRYSTNSGATWQTSTGVTGTVRALRTANGSLVLALADNKVYKSTNGGVSFVLEPMPLASNGRSVWLDADNYGYIVGDGGVAYRIAPQGTGLKYTLVPTDANTADDKGTGIPAVDLRSVQFSDRLTGYVTGVDGLVLKTVDGGQHWAPTSSGGTGVPLLSLADGEHGTVLDGNAALGTLRDRSVQFGSRFWYDQLGRLVLSQNAKQYNIADYLKEDQYKDLTPALSGGAGAVRAYSYTLYDDIGRIVEVGELLTKATLATAKDESQVLYNYLETTLVPSGVRHQVTRTYYDEPAVGDVLVGFTQENLRPRVATVTYSEVPTPIINSSLLTIDYDRATHYSYDVHGNVKALVQEIKAPNGVALVKRLDYGYDLVSGKVNEVWYQKGKSDQFIHKYEYDGDNRITKAHTSREGVVWDEDAKYDYYAHGPLAHMELGSQKVESSDYAYTLQGWIKGVQGQNFSYGLGYYAGDYVQIATPVAAFPATPVAKGLYNGNIATWSTNTPQFAQMAEPQPALLTQQFEYDQLNRIKQSTVLAGTNANSYKTSYSYDANGNLKTLDRFDQVGGKLDQFAYNYEDKNSGYKYNSNKLRWVDELAGVTADNSDLEDQDRDNYEYDDIGNLNIDKQEDIEKIEWNVYGKVKAVVRKSTSSKVGLEFLYDASGNRVAKIAKDRFGVTTSTYYVRDAQGNVMGVYDQVDNGTATLLELHMYGSRRLGMIKPAGLQAGTHTLGSKYMEISDFLGNVRVTLSDLKDNTGNPNVASATEYYPFGMGMSARSYVGLEGYRYGFNGHEREKELGSSMTSAEYWMYDGRLGRRWNIDPITKDWESPYAAFKNNPILFKDKKGLDGEPAVQMSIADKHFLSKDSYFPRANEIGGSTTIVSDPLLQTRESIKGLYKEAYNMAKQMGKTEEQFKLSNGQTWRVNTATGKFIPISGEGIIVLTREQASIMKNLVNNVKQGVSIEKALSNIATQMKNIGYSGQINGDFHTALEHVTTKNKGTLNNLVGALSDWYPPGSPTSAEQVAAKNAFSGKSISWSKVGGRTLLVVAVAADVYEVYNSEHRMKTITKKVYGYSIGHALGTTCAGVAAVGGQLGPQALAPEEVITVPLSYACGFTIGYFIGETVVETVHEYVFNKVK